MTEPNEAAYGHGAENGHCCGLTKREEFAKAILQGYLSGGYTVQTKIEELKTMTLVEVSVLMADALIAKLNEKIPDEKYRGE